MASTADLIRDHVQSRHLTPARNRGDQGFSVVVGEVVRDLGLKNRTSAVCQALASRIFLTENNLVLELPEGPPSGLSTATKFTYRFAPGAARQPQLTDLLSLSGIGKTAFAALGGGEAWLRKQRIEGETLG